MRRIIFTFTILCAVTLPLMAQETAQPTASTDGFGFSLEAGVMPYYFVTDKQLHAFAAGGEARVYLRLSPVTFGLSYDLWYNTLWRTAASSATSDLACGSWALMGLEVFASIPIGGYVDVGMGVGGSTYRSDFYNDSDAWERYLNRFRIGLAMSAFVGIRFGLSCYDIAVRASFDFFPDYVIWAGVRNNLHFLDGILTVFVEPGVLFWSQNEQYAAANGILFTAKIGAVFDLMPVTWGGRPVNPPPDAGKVDKTKADEQLEALKTAKTGDVIAFTNIIFFPDEARIKEESIPILEQIAQFLINNPDVTVEFRGYTNALGTPDQEQELSKARAEAVKAFMLKKGISSFRMVTVGYGSIFSNTSEVVEANRRVEIKILSKGGR